MVKINVIGVIALGRSTSVSRVVPLLNLGSHGAASIFKNEIQALGAGCDSAVCVRQRHVIIIIRV